MLPSSSHFQHGLACNLAAHVEFTLHHPPMPTTPSQAAFVGSVPDEVRPFHLPPRRITLGKIY